MSAAASSSHSSVVSLNLDEDDSSVAQLDMKCEIIVENNDNSHRSMLPMASIPLPLNSNISESTPGPSFGSVALEECKQVTFGNQHFYQGPVTFVCDKNTIAAVTDARPNRSNNKSCLGLRKQFGERSSVVYFHKYYRWINDLCFRQDLAIKHMEIHIHCHHRRHSSRDCFCYFVDIDDGE